MIKFFLKKQICFLIILALVAEWIPLFTAKAEERVEVKNVKFTASGKQIVVTYDLQGPTDKEYLITVQLKRKQVNAFDVAPKALNGDVGDGKFAGTGKQIVWELFKEFPQGLDGDDYYFIVKAEMKSSGSGVWWWVAGGAVVVGGGAAVLLGKSKGSGSTTIDNGFPAPLGRPK